MLKIQRRSGPLATEEVEKENNCLIIKTHEGVDLNSREAQKLGLTLFNDGIVRCVGRIQSEEPIFIPRESIYMLLNYVRKSTKKLDTKALISPWQRLGKGTGYQD